MVISQNASLQKILAINLYRINETIYHVKFYYIFVTFLLHLILYMLLMITDMPNIEAFQGFFILDDFFYLSNTITNLKQNMLKECMFQWLLRLLMKDLF